MRVSACPALPFLLAAFVALPLPAQQVTTPPATTPATTPAKAAAAPGSRDFAPDDLQRWKTIRNASLSADGRWFAYVLAPNEGDAELVVRPMGEGAEKRFAIGEPPAGFGFGGPGAGAPVAFSRDGKWLAFTVYPKAAEAKRLRTQRRPVQNSVTVLELASGQARTFDAVRRFTFAGDRPRWMAMHAYDDAPAGGPPAGGAPPGAPGGAAAAARDAGADMLLHELGTGTVLNVGNVAEFAFDRSGQWLAYTIDARERIGNGVHLRNMSTDVVRVLESERALYRRLAWADTAATLAVLRGVPDTVAKDTSFVVVGFAQVAAAQPRRVLYVAADSTGMPAGMRVSPDRSPRWTEDQSALLFGIVERRTAPDGKPRPDVRPVAGAPGAITQGGPAASGDDDLPTLVIWHGKDPRLQSQQQVEESRDKVFSHLAAWRPAERRFVRLSDDALRTVTPAPRDRWAIGSDVRAYERQGNLDGLRFRDVYAVDMRTGERTRIVEKSLGGEFPSPDGTKVLYYSGGHFFVYDLATKAARNITEGVPTNFWNDEDDHNMEKPMRFPVGWAKDNTTVLLSDGWDIWKVPVRGGAAVNLTRTGKAEQVRYRGRLQWDPEERGIDLARPLYVSTYGEWTKKSGYALVDAQKGGATSLVFEDAMLAATRARDAEVFAFTRQTFVDFPDWWATDARFASRRRLTDANPQQKDFAWSSGVRLVDYTSEKGKKLQASLHLPANYQPGKKYPTMVYIYEKLSQGAHAYAVPNETRALNPSVYTAAGYAVLQPDIVYEINDPGMSAVWSVVPAVKAAIATGVVDSANVGLHGHSWGGYQTAFLVTQTSIFKSAIAGAALTDMVSMYSSVYWNTGSANQPIFESSQGRFKGNFLDNTDAYVRNSPAYHAKNIQTPLLLLHNEKDGAVDFNQGITFYNTLRELGKDVVLLQYVGENHGLAQPRNQKDYAVRMREYFDHYLLGKPAPDWLKDGIPRLRMEEHLKARQQKPKVAM
jgi:dipeptidyl aminopeptidase/acylaminoacyl peptidase